MAGKIEFSIDINKKMESDLKYIKNDLIARQKTGEYIKFSKILNCVAVMNMSKDQYEKYWKTQYRNYPDRLKIILKAVDEKFSNNLLDKDIMIELVKKSKDFEDEKLKAIKSL